MSVASEFPPEVHIPARARRGSVGQRHLSAVPAGLVVVNPPPVGSAPGARVMTFQPSVPVLGRRVGSPARICNDELRPTTASSREPAPLRLTRRGIVVLSALAVAAAGLMLLVAHLSLGMAPHSASVGSASTGSTSSGAVSSNVVVVRNGDTLWSIAQRVRPTADPRAVVDQLQRANHLNTVDLSPGQTLKLG